MRPVSPANADAKRLCGSIATVKVRNVGVTRAIQLRHGHIFTCDFDSITKLGREVKQKITGKKIVKKVDKSIGIHYNEEK